MWRQSQRCLHRWSVKSLLVFTLIPFDNQRHLIDVPEEVKKEVEYVPVKYYDEIYNQIFLNNNSVENDKNIKSKNKAK